MTRISVIVPAYNEEKYIEATLKSLSEQTYKDFEVIVVDNNSKDATSEIAKRYTPHVFLETAKGHHNAVRCGVGHAAGDIIVVADADTRYPKDWLQKIMSEFEKDPSIIGVYGTTRFYDHNFFVNFMSEPAYNIFLRYSKLIGHDTTPGFNFAVKKDAYLKAGGYDPAIYNGINADVELGRRVQRIGKLKLNTRIRSFTSARRYKEDGLFTTLRYYLDAWSRFNKGKTQKISYEEYNKEIR